MRQEAKRTKTAPAKKAKRRESKSVTPEQWQAVHDQMILDVSNKLFVELFDYGAFLLEGTTEFESAPGEDDLERAIKLFTYRRRFAENAANLLTRQIVRWIFAEGDFAPMLGRRLRSETAKRANSGRVRHGGGRPQNNTVAEEMRKMLRRNPHLGSEDILSRLDGKSVRVEGDYVVMLDERGLPTEKRVAKNTFFARIRAIKSKELKNERN